MTITYSKKYSSFLLLLAAALFVCFIVSFIVLTVWLTRNYGCSTFYACPKREETIPNSYLLEGPKVSTSNLSESVAPLPIDNTPAEGGSTEIPIKSSIPTVTPDNVRDLVTLQPSVSLPDNTLPQAVTPPLLTVSTSNLSESVSALTIDNTPAEGPSTEIPIKSTNPTEKNPYLPPPDNVRDLVTLQPSVSLPGNTLPQAVTPPLPSDRPTSHQLPNTNASASTPQNTAAIPNISVTERPTSQPSSITNATTSNIPLFNSTAQQPTFPVDVPSTPSPDPLFCPEDSTSCRIDHIVHFFEITPAALGKIVLILSSEPGFCICNQTENLKFRQAVKDSVKNFSDPFKTVLDSRKNISAEANIHLMNKVLKDYLMKIKELAKSYGYISEAVDDITNDPDKLVAYDVYETGPYFVASSFDPFEWVLYFRYGPPYFLPGPSLISMPFPKRNFAKMTNDDGYEEGNNLSLCSTEVKTDAIQTTFSRASVLNGMMELQGLPRVCEDYADHLSNNVTSIMKKWEKSAVDILATKPLNQAQLKQTLRSTFVDIKKILTTTRAYLVKNFVDDIQINGIQKEKAGYHFLQAISRHPFEFALNLKWAPSNFPVFLFQRPTEPKKI